MWQMPHVITIRENNIKCITRFNQSEMKRLYRIFKSECPSGLITEEVFHNIFSKFFPLGAESYNGKLSEINEIHPEFIIFIIEWVNIAIAIHCIDCIAALSFVFYRNPPTVRGLLLLMSAIQYISDLWSAYSIFQFIWSLLISSKRELLLPLCFLSTSAGWLWSHYVWGKLCLRNKISNFPQQCIEGVLELIWYIFQDFVVGLSILVNGTQEEKLEWTFHLYDLDGDGVITREEMEDVAMSVSSCKVFYDASSMSEWDFISNISLLNVS